MLRNAEDALDAMSIADGNLQVSLFEKSGTGIQRSTLDKNTLDGVKNRKALRLEKGVEPSNYGTIEFSSELILAVGR